MYPTMISITFTKIIHWRSAIATRTIWWFLAICFFQSVLKISLRLEGKIFLDADNLFYRCSIDTCGNSLNRRKILVLFECSQLRIRTLFTNFRAPIFNKHCDRTDWYFFRPDSVYYMQIVCTKSLFMSV